MTIDKLEALLDEMNSAIKTANFSKLETLISETEFASETLQFCTLPSDLKRLKGKALVNSAAALAAGRGVRAALYRIKEIQENAFTLVTYDRLGKREEVYRAREVTRRL